MPYAFGLVIVWDCAPEKNEIPLSSHPSLHLSPYLGAIQSGGKIAQDEAQRRSLCRAPDLPCWIRRRKDSRGLV
ncbi:MAG: hypothetical protein LBU11_03200, partial [Zoogloeaceae bacterium]|nr:hypothetical protein [Zoogloeaceae bacterium]